MCQVLKIFDTKIYLYNICVMLGFLIGYFVFLIRSRKVFKPEIQDSIIAMIGADIPFIIAGAILHNKFAYANSINVFFDIMPVNTGIAFLGGFIGGLIGFLLLFPVFIGKQVLMIEVMNELAPSIIVGHAVGRVGCLLAGCCYGKPSEWGIIYEAGTPAYNTYGAVKLFPVPIVEIIFLFVLFFIVLAKREKAASIYLTGYAVIRFFLEFLRGDVRGGRGLLSPAQKICVSIFAVMAGINCAIWYKRHHLKFLALYFQNKKIFKNKGQKNTVKIKKG